jgi:CubicO group peptidase (beta-lactamase class C family)
MKSCVLKVVACLVLLCRPSIGATESLDEIIHEYLQSSGVPGLNVSVIKGDEVIHEAAYGLANVELQVPVSQETVYQIASTTKVFTGVAIMMLVERGELTLDDLVTGIVPGLPESWNDVTVYHILTHTSGLPDALDDRGRAIAESPEQLFEMLANVPPKFRPGDDWSYIQTGFVLAGEIIRIRTGLSFDEFCKVHIFRPLGMNSTVFGDVHHLVPNRASYYTKNESDALVPHVGGIYPPLTWTGAGVNTSAGDFARFDIALRRGRLLKPETVAIMHSPVRLNNGTVFRHRSGTTGYGCGWAHIDYPGHAAVGMEGGLTNAYYRFVEDDLAIIILTNFVGHEPPSLLLEKIASHFIADFLSPVAERRQLEHMLAAGDSSAAGQGRRLVDDSWSNAAMLNSLAWLIATTDSDGKRDLPTALRAATQAVALTGEADAGIIDTLARVHYEMGNTADAIHWQQGAVDLVGEDELKEALRSTLSEYRRAASNADK